MCASTASLPRPRRRPKQFLELRVGFTMEALDGSIREVRLQCLQVAKPAAIAFDKHELVKRWLHAQRPAGRSSNFNFFDPARSIFEHTAGRDFDCSTSTPGKCVHVPKMKRTGCGRLILQHIRVKAEIAFDDIELEFGPGPAKAMRHLQKPSC